MKSVTRRLLTAIYFIVLFGTVSCSEQHDRVSVSMTSEAPLAFIIRDAEYTSYRNDDEYIRDAWVEVSYPEVFGEDSVATARINKAITSHVASLVAGYVPGDYDSTASIEMLAAHFIESHDKFVIEFPDAAVGHEWQCEVEGSVFHNTSACVTVVFKLFAYTGGAHPNHGTTIFSFDTVTGAALTLDDVVSDREAFVSIAEREFRRKYNVPQSASLNESGFMFDNNTFTLTDNFGVQGDGLRFIYPLYAVAPYVAGIIEFKVPFQSVSGLILRKDLFE